MRLDRRMLSTGIVQHVLNKTLLLGIERYNFYGQTGFSELAVLEPGNHVIHQYPGFGFIDASTAPFIDAVFDRMEAPLMCFPPIVLFPMTKTLLSSEFPAT